MWQYSQSKGTLTDSSGKTESEINNAINVVVVANELFKDSKPLEGEPLIILKDTLKKSMSKDKTSFL